MIIAKIIGAKEEKEILGNSPFKMHDKRAIMKKYNCSMKTAERAMKKLGLIHTSPENIECILRYQNGEKVSDLKKEYNMSQANLNALMRYRNIPQRGTQHFCNFRYFENIDTEDKAYFLGFIYADGNLYRNSMKITIRDYDIDVLEKLKKYMNSNHPIYKKPLSDWSGKEVLKKDGIVELIISQKKIREDLNKHGVFPNKTHTLESLPSTVSDKLIKHFIRGYIDGDGSFGRYVHNDGYERSSVNIVGTKKFLIELSHKVSQLTGINFNTTLYDRYPERETNTRALTMTGNEKVLDFLNWVYDSSTVYMNRKHDVYLNMIK